jgi:GTPase
VIGKAGAGLKRIGTAARKDIEKIVAKKVFLRLWVKVKDNWVDDERALKSLGYD